VVVMIALSFISSKLLEMKIHVVYANKEGKFCVVVINSSTFVI